MNNSNIINSKLCPNCNSEMNKLTRETKFFYYYKCPNCNKIFKEKKTFTNEEAIFLIGEQLQKTKEAIYCILGLFIIWFLINFINWLAIY